MSILITFKAFIIPAILTVFAFDWKVSRKIGIFNKIPRNIREKVED